LKIWRGQFNGRWGALFFSILGGLLKKRKEGWSNERENHSLTMKQYGKKSRGRLLRPASEETADLLCTRKRRGFFAGTSQEAKSGKKEPPSYSASSGKNGLAGRAGAGPPRQAGKQSLVTTSWKGRVAFRSTVEEEALVARS